jgi:diguanylate cyclase (GGDEF)-like protein
MVKTVNVDLKSLTQSELLLVAEELRRQVASWSIKHRQVRIEVKMLRHQVLTDALTGVGNRRSFNESLENEMARTKRNLGKPLSLAILDIDFFKKINEAYGHAGGDAVLKTLGAFLLKFARTTDTACRIGGEEFVLILPGTSALGAFTLVER